MNNLSSFNLRITPDTFADLVKQNLVFSLFIDGKKQGEGKVLFNTLLLGEDYTIDTTVPIE